MPTISMFYGSSSSITSTTRDTIVANRITDEIRDVTGKVYSRHLFGSD